MNLIRVFLVSLLCAFAVPAAGAPGFFTVDAEDRPSASSSPAELKKVGHMRAHGANGHFIDLYYDAFNRLVLMESKNKTRYDILYANVFSKTPSGMLVNGKETPLPMKRSSAKFASPDEDFETLNRQFRDLLESYGDCIGCVGILDSLASWLQIAAGIGSVIGASIAEITGAGAQAWLTYAGYGGVVGIGVVIAFVSGFVVGVYLYDYWGNVVWSHIP